MHTRPLSLILATLALALVVACGGSDKDGGGVLSGGNSGVNWDVSKADDLSHAALLVATDLGGTGWRADDDADDDAMTAAACADFESFKKDGRAAAVARAKRSLEKQGSNDFGTEVESTIQIVKDAKTAADLVKRYQGVVNSDKFIPCFEASIKEDTSKDAKVVIKKLTPTGSAPNGGSATALDVDVSLGRDQLLARTENYVWQSGNAIIQLNVTATKDSFNADLIKTAISKQDQAANDAVKGSRTRVSESQASSASTAATPTPQRANPTPSATARPGGTATPTRGASSSSLGNLGMLEDTNSHRYTIKIESSGIDFLGMQDLAESLATLSGSAAPRAGAPITVEMTGAYSKPDKGQVKFSVNSTVMSLTTIGTQQWTQLGTTTQGPRNVGRQAVDDLSVAVAMLSAMSGDDALLGYLKCAGNENVNGVAARKCGFTQGELGRTELQGFVDGFLEDSDANVKINAADVTKATFYIWASTQGDYPVRLLFEFSGKDTRGTAFNMRMESNVSDINRPVDIVAPR